VPGIPLPRHPNQWQTDAGVGVASQRGPIAALQHLAVGIATAAT
jgi:beta-glucosidase